MQSNFWKASFQDSLSHLIYSSYCRGVCGDHQLLYQWRWNWIFPVGVILSLSPYFKSFLFCGLLDLFVYIVLFFFSQGQREQEWRIKWTHKLRRPSMTPPRTPAPPSPIVQILLDLFHLPALSPILSKLTLPYFYLSLLILSTRLSILLTHLALFLRHVSLHLLESLPSLLTLDLLFPTLCPCLLNLCLPRPPSELYPCLSPLLSPNAALGPVLLEGQSGFLGELLLGGGGLPGAGEAKLPQLLAVKPLPSPATFGLIFNLGEPPLEAPLLMVP